jgi:Fe-S oxidoreductase
MGGLQLVAAVLAAAVTVVAVAMVVRAVRRMLAIIRLGRPDPQRFTRKRERARAMLTEVLAHTRMLKWGVVGASHWFVMVGFGALFFTLVEAYGEVVKPSFELPLIGGWGLYGLATELIAVTTGLGIAVLIVIRLRNRPGRGGRTRVGGTARSRFAGSTMWQAYYVEWTIVGIVVCILSIRGLKAAAGELPYPVWAAPVSHAIGNLSGVLTTSTAGNAITLVALAKIGISMAWFIVIALNLTMGVAWHRFAAFFNIFFKRSAAADRPALGGLRPMLSNGEPLNLEEADPEKDQFGVAAVEQFTWKGLLDFSTCTECGRCQSQCPAWNTGKPLSPKLLVLSLRDHAYAKAPYLMATAGRNGAADAAMPDLSHVDALALAESERPLVGGAAAGGVIDPDVLWSCTTCGACVEQCPVDIEHVDHIVDMRRYQVLIESNFPPEAGVMLRNLENKGNPWGAPPNTRTDWTKGLGFEVPRVADGADFEYLFWVGCAGAFEDRAKKTTRAVATLLHEAGVSFAILGEGETCTGDPARRIGNEFLFQLMAQQNVETLNDAGVKKIVATCPHCFNTLANEYGQLSGDVGWRGEVLHHTQLLGHLVGTGRLTPVQPLDGGVTYHDPCYLGRHNRVFAPPRHLLEAIEWSGGRGRVGPGMTEMDRFAERSFCCGAGGARMWMEERIGKRINIERVEEAIGTGARTVAAACPFCLTMLSDGVTAKKSTMDADVEVVDVATILLRSLHPDA